MIIGKKTLIIGIMLLLLSFILLGFIPKVVYAENETNDIKHLRINEGCILYRNPIATIENQITTLNSGYQINYISQIGDFYEVSVFDNSNGFNRIYGYCLVDKVTLEEFDSRLNYPEVSLTVTNSNAQLYENNQLTKISATVFYGQQLKYLGYMQIENQTYYYVNIANSYGYIEKSNVSELVLPEIITDSPNSQPTTQIIEKETLNKNIFNAQSIALTILILTGIPCLIAIVKITNKKTPNL